MGRVPLLLFQTKTLFGKAVVTGCSSIESAALLLVIVPLKQFLW